MRSEYEHPISQLFDAPECKGYGEWPDYVAQYGLTREHVPDLICMALDIELGDSREPAEYWAPVHAWRALGQLRAVEAVEPLLDLFYDEDDDWISETLPKVYGMIGPAAIPALTAFISDDEIDFEVRLSPCECLEQIGKMHPEARPECIQALSSLLENSAKNNPTLNGFLVSALMDLKAKEAFPVIQHAFWEGHVDTTIVDWLDVQDWMGLKHKPRLGQGGALKSLLPQQTGLKEDLYSEVNRILENAQRRGIPLLEPEFEEEEEEDWDESEEEYLPEYVPPAPSPAVSTSKNKKKAKAKHKQAEKSRKVNKKKKH